MPEGKLPRRFLSGEEESFEATDFSAKGGVVSAVSGLASVEDVCSSSFLVLLGELVVTADGTACDGARAPGELLALVETMAVTEPERSSASGEDASNCGGGGNSDCAVDTGANLLVPVSVGLSGVDGDDCETVDSNPICEEVTIAPRPVSSSASCRVVAPETGRDDASTSLWDDHLLVFGSTCRLPATELSEVGVETRLPARLSGPSDTGDIERARSSNSRCAARARSSCCSSSLWCCAMASGLRLLLSLRIGGENSVEAF